MELAMAASAATVINSAVLNVLVSVLLLKRTDGVNGNFVVPGLSPKQFVKLGDINIGFLLPMSGRTSQKLCNGTLRSNTVVQITQAVEYAVDQINEGGQLPGNVTLGFVVLDDCGKESAAVAQALAFVPQSTCQASGPITSSDQMTSYDVVGVIGATTSSQTVGVAYVLGPAQIPQFRAIFSIIQQYGWSYISVVYREGSYGENGFKQLRDLFEQHHVCLAAVRKVPYALTDKEADTVARDLVEHKNARVVVVIAFSSSAEAIMKAASALAPPGTFIWIGSDGWANSVPSMAHLGQHLWDAFVVRPVQAYVPEYNTYFKSLTA
ncbi:hypothetical protein BaRGS_00001969, partial [Batillaria attramentaria]